MIKEFIVYATEVIVNVSGTTKFPVKVYHTPADNGGWVEGDAVVSSEDYQYLNSYSFSAKVYDTPSTFGINKGRISKLYVRDISANTEVIGYDREWYCEPQYPQEKAVLEALLTIFATSM